MGVNMDIEKITELLCRIARELDQCADDVPDEISARNNLYSRMKEAAKEARMLEKSLSE
jgi:hypothetical protein